MPFQPVGPLWVLEYVSPSNKRKDYEDNFRKYERELKVPYYLLFYPDNQELTLFKLKGRKYVSVKPNEQGRVLLAELELEMALLDGWVRYWYQGVLLPLPADLQRDLDEAHRLLTEATRRAEEQTRRAEEQTRRAKEEREARLAIEQELAELRAQLERPRRKRNNHGSS